MLLNICVSISQLQFIHFVIQPSLEADIGIKDSRLTDRVAYNYEFYSWFILGWI